MLNPQLIDISPASISKSPQSSGFTTGSTAPTSVVTQAQVALNHFQSDALAETSEDLSFILGGRLRAQQRSRSNNDASVRGRIMMHKLVDEVTMSPPAGLDSLLNGEGDWQQAYQNIQDAMQAGILEPGPAALQLAVGLAHGRAFPRTRSLMEDTLATLIAEDGTALSLFGLLEFGVVTPALRQELVLLYQRTYAPRQQLSQWLAMLGERRQRKRKLRTMLRLISFELTASGEPIVGSHLAAVIGDLRQVLRVIGLEEHCDQAALALGQPAISGESLMTLLVQLVENIWINADAVEEMLPPQPLLDRYHLLQSIVKLVQLLPGSCFNDIEHREQLRDAIMTLCDGIVDLF